MSVSFTKDDVQVTSASPRDSSDREQEKQNVVAGSVPTKYRGTDADRRDMITLGKKQVLRVCKTNALDPVPC